MIKEEFIREWFLARRELYSNLQSRELVRQVLDAYKLIKKSLDAGGKILIFGNGGSAAQAQHFAAELVGRFEKRRKALPAIALTTDTSILTAQANDEGFETIFSRQIEALGQKGDVVFGITTSDTTAGSPHSVNILKGFESARTVGLKSIGLFSQKTKNLISLADVSIIVPHTNTAIIQEVHLAVIHFLCKLIENNL